MGAEQLWLQILGLSFSFNSIIIDVFVKTDARAWMEETFLSSLIQSLKITVSINSVIVEKKIICLPCCVVVDEFYEAL